MEYLTLSGLIKIHNIENTLALGLLLLIFFNNTKKQYWHFWILEKFQFTSYNFDGIYYTTQQQTYLKHNLCALAKTENRSY